MLGGSPLAPVPAAAIPKVDDYQAMAAKRLATFLGPNIFSRAECLLEGLRALDRTTDRYVERLILTDADGPIQRAPVAASTVATWQGTRAYLSWKMVYCGKMGGFVRSALCGQAGSAAWSISVRGKGASSTPFE